MPLYISIGSSVIEDIVAMRKIIFSPKLRPYTDNQEDQAHLIELFTLAANKIKKSPDSPVYNANESPRDLLNRWKSFFGGISDESDTKDLPVFLGLWAQTQELLKDIIAGREALQQHLQVRKRASEDVREDLQSLEARQKNIVDQIEKEKSKGSKADQNIIATLERTLNELQPKVQEKQKEQETVMEEEQTESNWDKRIEEAFALLKGCTGSVEEEKKRSDDEYKFYHSATIAIVIAAVLWLIILYIALLRNHITLSSWNTFAPYYLPIPIMAALLWVFIVQKNRANKLSIMMSEELFRIRYLENLLLSVNKLSKNSDTSISRINKAIDSMVESYLHQTERTMLSEEKISAIEKKELSTNKMMQWMDKLIDKV